MPHREERLRPPSVVTASATLGGVPAGCCASASSFSRPECRERRPAPPASGPSKPAPCCAMFDCAASSRVKLWSIRVRLRERKREHKAAAATTRLLRAPCRRRARRSGPPSSRTGWQWLRNRHGYLHVNKISIGQKRIAAVARMEMLAHPRTSRCRCACRGSHPAGRLRRGRSAGPRAAAGSTQTRAAATRTTAAALRLRPAPRARLPFQPARSSTVAAPAGISLARSACAAVMRA
jgi:hypothetical protein